MRILENSELSKVSGGDKAPNNRWFMFGEDGKIILFPLPAGGGGGGGSW